MSLKDLFKESKYKSLSNASLNSLTASGIESPEFIEAYIQDKNRFVPLVDYSRPENFARFGSAEKYYYDSISRIYDTYPYDGSKKEKVFWELSSSHLDLYILENGYPRTTGYAVFSTASLNAIDTSTDYDVWGSYGAAGTGTYEYISFNGGPHPGTGPNVYIDPDTGQAHYRKGANIYDLSENRECNLKIGGNDGNTVEFWLKKAAFDTDATQTEVLFDIFTTASISSSLDYARLTVEISGHGAGTNTLSPFYVTYMSGTDGISKQNIGTSLTTASIADDKWHHYALRFKNTGSNISVDLFVDGDFNSNVTDGTTIDYVSGTIVGSIGALATHPSGTDAGAPQADKGWGKLSGSIDELRFWKVWRDSKQIQTRWFDQVGGGTNTDDANTHLGLYYKFNEGITLTSSTDSLVLDYSGRVSNGTWTGYNSVFSRDIGSAINECGLTSFTGSEFRDPIVYPFHPEVVSFMDTKRKEGREYDYRNPSTIYYSLPAWILDEHDANNPDNEGIIANSLWNLTQILSSYFDNVANLAKSVPQLKQASYFSGSQKPIPFMSRILESKGFVAPEIFNAIDALEQFENRDDNSLYTEKISNIKNIIYKNIYNNLSYINKSKGTEKSFRNLIRCFGIDDQVYKLNYYGNNVDYLLEDNFRTVSKKFKVVNFNKIDNANATVFQYSSSLNPNTVTFISASKDFSPATSQEASLPFTVEASMVFPKRVDEGDYHTLKHNSDQFQNLYSLMLTSSIFGMHTAIDGAPEWTEWAADDYANFVVKAVKPEKFSNKAKFVLTGTLGGFIPELTSSYYDEVYNNTPWNLMVSLYSEKYVNDNSVDGAEASNYIVEFSGIQKVLDITINEFTLTGTLTADEATKFLASPKRIFAGSHKTNFTGSTLQPTDVNINSVRAWQNKLTIEDLSIHGSDLSNYSIRNPEQNAYLFNDGINRVYVPNKETLLLHWNFENVTGSDASGEFIVEDFTSGSAEQIPRYGFLRNMSNKQFTGLGYNFVASDSDVVKTEDFVTAKPNIPEVLANENTIKVLTNDDIYFTRDSRPTFFDLYVEKSPYQNISEDMLNFMSTVVDFNNLIGQGVDRYREEYKSLKMLRQLFFQRTKTPDIDKYIEYFKWFDLAVTAMVQKLAPMSSGLDERPLRNIIESHILERNKYQSKFPTYEFKQTDPEASLFGINEMLYPWKEGHAPISEEQSDNCLWSKERGERSDELLTSGDEDIDSDRQQILDTINNLNNATAPNLSGSSGTYQGSTYALRRFARPYKINAVKQQEVHGGGNAYENKKVGFWDSLRKRPTPDGSEEGAIISIEPPDTQLESFKDCDDNLELNKGKRKYRFSAGVSQDGATEFAEIYKGDLIFPFSLYSSSVNSNPAYADLADFQENLAITNLHHDNYGPFNDVPMQGPFTEKYVGGRPYRHVMTNFTPDNNPPYSEGERLEGWRLTASVEGNLDLVNVDPAFPKSVYFREEYAKRPVNIKNIQQLTGAIEAEDQATDASGVTKIGNYTNTYEIVMTNGRSINNRYLVESEGELASITADSTAVSGVVDFALPRRDLTGSNKAIIVNRFSAPGDPATMAEGMLDIAAGEYSVYNALPFRNLSVRQPLQELLTDHANQFGLFSDARTVADYERASWADYPGGSSSIDDPGADLDYIGTGSFHKVNRNGRKQPRYTNEFRLDLGTVEVDTAHDNYFVQHQIPQTDVQYAWITASIVSDYTGSALYGHEQPDFSNASLASTDLTFVSASDSGSANIKVDFVGLNTLIVDGVLSGLNLLSSSDYYNDQIESLDDVLTTNALLSHRGGPAGDSNWKLYRKDNHKIVREHREENRLSFLKPVFGFNSDNEKILLSGSKGSINSVIEPPITSKYKQISHLVGDNIGGSQITINHSYMNNIKFFTDHSNDRVNLNQLILDPNKNTNNQQQMLDVINYYLYESNDFDGAMNALPIGTLFKYNVKETIYPKEQYTYLSTHRQREDYVNAFWRDSIEDRQERGSGGNLSDQDTLPYGYLSAVGSVVFGFPYRVPAGLTASIWPLDARENFATEPPARIASASLEALYNFGAITGRVPAISGSDGTGILQNAAYPYSVYARISSSVTDDEYIPFVASLFPQYNRRIAGALSTDTTHEYKFGDTKWQAGDQSGKSPFYDTYEEYVEDIKRIGKDHTIIPEFRISNHMDFYLNEADNGFLSTPAGCYEMTGAILSASNELNFMKTYSHSDFLKTFKITNDIYGDQAAASKITLSAEALIKFLPYNGFYPADRTVDLTKLFYESYEKSFFIEGDIFKNANGDPIEPGDTLDAFTRGFINPVWKPLFAPGILYNSIKSGIAVDYPIHTGSVVTTGEANQRLHNNQFLGNIPRISASLGLPGFGKRIPFQALLEPEAYLNELVYDQEPHPSASINVSASLTTAGKLNYTLAMNNFLASTIDFFKPGGNLTTIVSAPDDGSNGFGEDFDPKKEYRMRVVCYNGQFGNLDTLNKYIDNGISAGTLNRGSTSYEVNPPTCIMYAQTGAFNANDTTKQSDYYGSAFGPPVSNESGLGTLFSSEGVYPLYGSASYEPFTPPYYDGYSHIEYVFRPEDAGMPAFTDLNLPDILANIEENGFDGGTNQGNYKRFVTGWNQSWEDPNNSSIATLNRMQLTASVDLKIIKQATVEFDPLGNPIVIKKDDTASNVLTIQPKWETPILNFKDVDVEIPDIGSGSIARGMWHQYGRKTENNEGIYLQVQDLKDDEKENKELTGSLASLIGLSTAPRKLGTVAESKTISEAIVAIPYFINDEGDTEKYKISKNFIDIAKELASLKNPDKSPDIGTPGYPDQSIVDMVEKMQRFVIPPHLDFITNSTSVDPFAMFIFEFSVDLTEKDLTDIWQNLNPSVGTSVKKKNASLPVDIFNVFEDEAEQSGKLMPGFSDSTRWQVFKVKQRSAYNYFAKTADSADDTNFKFQFDFGDDLSQQTGIPSYSYNWPYDFFSLIELVKIDADVESKPVLEYDGTIPVGLGPQTKVEPELGVIGSSVNSPKDAITSTLDADILATGGTQGGFAGTAGTPRSTLIPQRNDPTGQRELTPRQNPAQRALEFQEAQTPTQALTEDFAAPGGPTTQPPGPSPLPTPRGGGGNPRGGSNY